MRLRRHTPGSRKELRRREVRVEGRRALDAAASSREIMRGRKLSGEEGIEGGAKQQGHSGAVGPVGRAGKMKFDPFVDPGHYGRPLSWVGVPAVPPPAGPLFGDLQSVVVVVIMVTPKRDTVMVCTRKKREEGCEMICSHLFRERGGINRPGADGPRHEGAKNVVKQDARGSCWRLSLFKSEPLQATALLVPR
mmetsp:Transcript_9669/g.28953  ORF Transcript_9669/g.28953 Transcript_9669/m.28953 type:complete len:193 (-) Transcript_9669:233-811(-)